MIVSQGPVIHHQLSTELRELREAQNLRQKDVAAALDWSVAKVRRIETGAVRVSTTDLKALLGYYGVDDQQRVNELVGKAQAVRALSWSEYRGFLVPDFLRYLSYESAAERVCNFQALLLPGLLQTESYARATIRGLSPAEGFDNPTVERLVEARMRRQELLHAESRPEMVFILDESVIRRRVGKGDQMAQQLEHLKQVARLPGVQIRIVPYDAGVHPGLIGSFVVLEFPNERDNIVYLEDARADLVPRDWREDVPAYQSRFATLEDTATPGDRLNEVIDRAHAALGAADCS